MRYNNKVLKVIFMIENNYHKNISLDEMSRHVGLNKHYLARLFKKSIGFTIWDYLIAYRIKKAKALLSNNDKKIKDICIEVGINDLSYFERLFKKHTGLTPGNYKKQAVKNDKSGFKYSKREEVKI